MATTLTKTIKEIVTDIGGNTTIEFSDDSLQQYNIKDTVTAQTNPVTGGIILLEGGRQVTVSPSSRESFRRLKLRPVGFNYYSLLPEIYYNMAGASTCRPINLQWIANTGANLVRVAFAGFSSSDYLGFIHSTAQMPQTVSDANLRSTFITACDTVMDALAAYGLKGQLCIAWGQSAIPASFSESDVTAYSSTSSMTATYVQSFARWLISRYKNHAALGLLSIGNEYLTDLAGVTNPTPAQLGAWMSAVSSAAKAVKSDVLTTSDFSSPTINLLRTRETIEQSVARYRTLFAGLDVYCLHIYNDDYAFTGHCQSEYGSAPNAFYSNLGYEGIESLMQAFSDMASADDKPLIIGECGVNTDNEIDDPASGSATFLSDKKKWKLARSIVPYADVTMFWNVQLTSIAASSGTQSKWCIDPSSTTNRAAQHAAIASTFNAGKPGRRNLGGAIAARKSQLRPRVSMKSANRGAGINVRFTTTAAHSSSTGYSMAFWVNLSAALNNGETISDFRNGTTAGFVLLALLESNAKSFYADGRYASGSSGNSNNALPDFSIGEWSHVCVQLKSMSVNGSTVYATEIWLNGVYWLTVSASNIPATIPIGTTAYVMCNSGNGVPMKMQDYALFPSITPEEIWRHMQGEISPRSLLHVRAFDDGTIADVSKNAVSLTVAGVTVSSE